MQLRTSRLLARLHGVFSIAVVSILCLSFIANSLVCVSGSIYHGHVQFSSVLCSLC